MWTTANLSLIAKLQEGIREEIVDLVSNLQLPVEYVREMLEEGSSLASVCAGTPTGETFLQDKFKFLQICDESSLVIFALPCLCICLIFLLCYKQD